MGNYKKLLRTVMSGMHDQNIRFSDLQQVLEICGFICRVREDHFIYSRQGVDEIINIQPQGAKAKPYQVKQVRNLIIEYKLGGDLDV